MPVYKVLIIKSGKFSLHPALGPVAILVEGVIEQFDKDTCQRLIDAQWAQWAKVDTEEDVDMDEDPDEDPDYKELLYKMIEEKEEPEAKTILQDWGMVKSDKKVSKAKSVENMIFEIIQNITKN